MTSIPWIFTGVFFASVFFIFYTYVIFPVLLGILVRYKRSREQKLQMNIKFPRISIIISVYNEEKVLRKKIESILESSYPKENLEIIIGSDASVDRTTAIARSLVSEYSFIKYFDYPNRRGKPSVINDLVSHASHEIILLTDANVIFDKQLIAILSIHFRDAKIGLVGANIVNAGMRKDGISIQEKSYIERENQIKYREGLLWGCMMGPFGGCYAIRKNLFEEVPANFLVDDFYHLIS